MRRMTIAAALIASLASMPAFADGPNVGDRAPAIKAPTWENLPKGMSTLKASDLKGRIIMLDFWATW